MLKFDTDGNLLASWGPASGNWVKNEHGIHVDAAGNVWIGGNNEGDQILQFSPDGKFIQQVGKDDGAEVELHDATWRPRVGDPRQRGKRNLRRRRLREPPRIVVFDSKTSAYKRHWGAGGTKTPHNNKLPAYSPAAASSPSFHNPVHCVRLSNDGLVYVCDRTNNHIQVFRKDGSYVKEFKVAPETLQNGAVWDLVLSEDPQQRFIFVADGASGQVITIDRENGGALTQSVIQGRQPGQFKWVHNIAIDSKGNLYTAEVGFASRVQNSGKSSDHKNASVGRHRRDARFLRGFGR